MEESEKKGFARRDFLKGVGSTALTAGLLSPNGAGALAAKPGGTPNNGLPLELQTFPTISANPSSEGYWTQVKKAFVLPNDYIHMNTGTTGSQPLFSQMNLAVYNNYKSMDPRDWEKNLNAKFPDLFPLGASLIGPSAVAARQAAVAAIYGANANEIVLTYNTTDACNLIFSGTPWNAGDRIITTSFEHPAIVGPVAWARDYHGVDVVVIDIPSNFDATITVPQVVGWFAAELAKPLPAGAKQYIAISDVFYKNGVRMPVKEICAAAKSYGAYTIIDTAHGWGMLPINCHDYEADFICGAGHKWLCGGPGTGILYVRTSGDNLPPFALGNFFLYGNVFQDPSAFYNSRAWPPNIFMQFRGESNSPALLAMTDSLSYFNYVGIQRIYDRGVALGNYLKDKISAKWGPSALWVQKNPDPRFATFLTSFNPYADKNDAAKYGVMNTAISAILAALAAQTPKIYIRSTTWRDSQSDAADNRVGFRISTHAMYNDRPEIDWMFNRLVEEVNKSGLPQLS